LADILPEREPRRTFLLPEYGIRADSDSQGLVRVRIGMDEPLEFQGELGSRVLKSLIRQPRNPLKSLDLQTYQSGLPALESARRRCPKEARERLSELGVNLDADEHTFQEQTRLDAVLRRIDVLEQISSSPTNDPLPKWAKDPRRRRKDLVAQLEAALAKGPLRADFPPIKNAAKTVRRALDDVLKRPELAAIRDCFHGREWIVYSPPE
jgi:hypothetical protein